MLLETTLPVRTFASLVLHRFEDGDDGSTVGFYDRRRRAFSVHSQLEFLRAAAGTADVLEEHGVRPRDVVAVVASSPEMLWRTFCAVLQLGAVPVLLPIRPSLDSSTQIREALDAAALAMPSAHLAVQHQGDRPCVDVAGRRTVAVTLDDGARDLHGRLARLDTNLDDLHHLQMTSGSTAAAKPVAMTHRQAWSSVRSLAARMDARPDDHVVSWLPLYHDMGLVGMAMLSLFTGAHLRLLSPFDFLSDPTHWLGAIGQSPGAITSAPNFAFDFATRRASDARMATVDLSTWKKCYCGAEPVDGRTIAAFIERFASKGLRPEAVQPTYGLAEATLMVTMPETGDTPHGLTISLDTIAAGGPVEVIGEVLLLPGDHGLDDPFDGSQSDAGSRTVVAALGTPADEMIVELFGPDGTPIVADDRCGEVVVSGPAVASGYLRPDGSVDAFPEGTCHTGDIGFLHAGELYLVERTKNILIRHGQNISASAVERQLAHAIGVSVDHVAVIDRSVVGHPEGVVAVIEVERGQDPDRTATSLVEVVRSDELPVDVVLAVGRGRLPRTTSGKKQHAQLRRDLRSGAVVPLVERSARPVMAPDEFGVLDLDALDESARALRVIGDNARQRGWRLARIDEDLRLTSDLGLDSLGLVGLSVELEAALGKGIPESRLGSLSTVGDLLRALVVESSEERSVGAIAAQLADRIPQVYRRVDEQRGRQLLVDDRWITDFASLNYLGFDLHPDVIAAIPPMVERWGVHPSWTRAVASPAPYFELEAETARLVGAPDVMVFSTITLLHLGVLPKLVGPRDTLIVDRGSHHSIQEAAELSGARGARVLTFDHRRPETLVDALAGATGTPLVAMNGVYSMTGAIPDLATLVEIARGAGARLYVDDAHGFGMLGARPTSAEPWGLGGSGVVTHCGLGYDDIVYVGGFSKAFSSMAAFVTCGSARERALLETASTSIFSGPVPVASIASALAGLAVNAAEGDERRRRLRRLTERVVDGCGALGFALDNALAFPIVNVVIGDVDRVVRASEVMWEHGILFTPSVFPAAPIRSGGFRISLTADNTDEDVDRLLHALAAVLAAVGPTEADAHLAAAMARPEI